jgi:peptidoglycan L-alanyl-D-glutamate endopeptidase CwlK
MMPDFSRRSLDNLIGVHEDLVNLALRAIAITEVDFAVIQGLRTVEQQAEYVSKGASQTMQSKHLIGHAIDIAAYIGGTISWDWMWYPRIALAFRQASIDLDIPVRWGCVWTANLDDLSNDLEAEVERYKISRKGKAFLDAGHFELHFSTGITT